MDIRNFFSKKGSKENGTSTNSTKASTGGVATTKKATNTVEQKTSLKGTTKPTPPTPKRKIQDDDDYDDEKAITQQQQEKQKHNPEVVVQRNKSNPHNQQEKQQVSGTKTKQKASAVAAKAKAPPATKRIEDDRDLFLNDTSDDDYYNNDVVPDDDDDVEFVDDDDDEEEEEEDYVVATSNKRRSTQPIQKKPKISVATNKGMQSSLPSSTTTTSRRSSPRSLKVVDPVSVRSTSSGTSKSRLDDNNSEQQQEETKRLASLPVQKPLHKNLSQQLSSVSSSKKGATSSSTKTQPKQEQISIVQPESIIQQDNFDMNMASSQCLIGFTFCFSGIIEDLSRDDATEMVKVLGGRVTTAVSSKTTYLVLGTILEDGRPIEQGSKYIRATTAGSSTILIHGKQSFYGLLQQYSDRQNPSFNNSNDIPSALVPPVPVSKSSPHNKEPPTTISQPVPYTTTTSESVSMKKLNPYATSTTSVAKASNPYARPSSSSNPYIKNTVSSATNIQSTRMMTTTNGTTAAATTQDMDYDLNRKMPATYTNNDTVKRNDDSDIHKTRQLWVDKYKPKHSTEILGNQDAVKKLSVWLSTWEDVFNTSRNKVKSFSAPNGPWKAALLSGPPGIGKTTTATLVANESGRDVLEFNASDVRSKKAMQEEMGDITGSHTLEFRNATGGSNRLGQNKQQRRTKRCIVMDEVDGMGAGDRSGMSELIQMIKISRVPIICICNDRQSQKMKSLLPYCMDLRYRRPTKSVIANRAVQVAKLEGLIVEPNAAEAIVESCGNDVRQVLNCLQMWSSSALTTSMTYRDLKERENSINKDEILRVSLFDAARVIVEGRKGLAGADMLTQRNHFFHRNDAYFVDYNFLGLLVQQNYLKVMQPQFNDLKRQNNNMEIGTILDRMHNASLSMSDWAIMDGSLHMDMNWSLLPATAALAVKTGYHAGGENGCILGGFPEFTTWLGRNSSRNKKIRIMSELCHHMNYKISASSTEMRISYLPLLRATFLNLLTGDGQESIQEAIDLMDVYGLDRDDIFEKLDEFNFDSSGNNSSKLNFSKIDSKKKANFTRLYNLGSHRSQALVAEQGAIKKNKRAVSSGMTELDDPDAINDDDDVTSMIDNNDDDDEDEQDIEKIRAAFQKKGARAASKKAAANTKKPPASRKKK